MKLSQYFKGSRFLQLLKVEGARGYKKTLLVGLAVFAFLLFVILVMASDHDFEDFHGIWYPIVLLGGGYLFTSTSLSELDTENSRMGYLSLPASTFEKFASKFLITNLGYLVFVTVVYWLFSLLSNTISEAYFNFSFQTFNPFREHYPIIVIVYITTHSIFLLGATAFNQYAIFKTFLSMTLTFLILAALTFLFIRIIYFDFFDGMFIVKHDILYRPSDQLENFGKNSLGNIVQFISYFVLTPLILAAGYFKLKEREV